MAQQATVQQSQGKVATLDSLRQPAITAPDVTMGFGTLQSFELMQRAAKLLSSSTLVPTQYRAMLVKTDRYGNIKEQRENPNALANAVVALNMAQRMGADPLMIMQNLYVIEGRPSWSSQFIIAAINGCGKFSPLRFVIEQLGEKSVEYAETYWENNQKQSRAVAVDIVDVKCIAWAIEKETGEKIEGPPVTIEMAVKEGWYTKSGSKWQTMPEVMLRYRAASFFGKLYSPELLMGLKTIEEEQDIIDISPKTGEILSISTENIRKNMKEAAAVDTAQPTPPATPSVEASLSDKEQGNQSEQDPSNSASNHVEKQEQPVDHQETPAAPQQFSTLVKKFMHEINEATKKGSLGVDQWRAHHNKRVERECGGSNTKDYRDVMDYAEMVYREVVESEKEQSQDGGKNNGNLF